MMAMGVAHLLMCVLLMFLAPQKGVYEIIDVLILICAVCRMDFCCLVMYVIYVMISAIQFLNLIGLAIQTRKLKDICLATCKTNE